jgi:hypothetical protein
MLVYWFSFSNHFLAEEIERKGGNCYGIWKDNIDQIHNAILYLENHLER